MEVTVIGCSTTWTDKPVSSYLLNKNILIDSGEGTIKYYKKCGVDLKNINHIFITHLHTDHFMGLSAHISQVLVYEGEDKKYRLNIYGPKGLLKALKTLQTMFACPTIDKKPLAILLNNSFFKPFTILSVFCKSFNLLAKV